MSDGLNPSQKLAVETLAGPLLVLAGAGTGKTRVVTYRIANLIRHRVPPQKILAVTFTNKAAREMQQRATQLLGKRNPQKPEISTFHSLCLRILRRQIQHLGYTSQFAIYDRGDQESLARQILQEIKCPTETLRPGDLLAQVGNWKTAALRPDDAIRQADTDKLHLAAIGYRRYQRLLRAGNAVDFDDLLLLTEELFGKFPQVKSTEAARFDHLLIDEYQDTNASQYRIVQGLAGGHRNLCVVGDDDQAIYGWRGAEVRHILGFQRDWPDAKVVRLEDNYRCTAQILELANRVIKFNKLRHDKRLNPARPNGDKPEIWQCADEEDEAAKVVGDIKRRLTQPGLTPRDFAILFRTNEQPRLFEQELRKQKIPYVLIGGQSFFERKEVRDITAYLRLLVRPGDDQALLRVINTPPRGIGETTIEALMAQANALERPVWGALQPGNQPRSLTPAAHAALDKFRQLIEKYTARLGKEPLLTLAEELINEVKYKEDLRRFYKTAEEAEERWNNVAEVFNALAAYSKRAPRPQLADFLDEITLSDRADQSDEKETQLAKNAVALMTLHSAKGLEFPQVYLVGLEENILPHHRSLGDDERNIDEERRLCYVGITRAQDRLTLTLCLGRNKWGKLRPTIPSRFLYELTGQAANAQEVAAKLRAAKQRADQQEKLLGGKRK
ncbi:MAG: UvrD-helicase domain-containing protein [Pirellulales bacterium]|nr:UvrD-helicase domain-containing protein [Pirellulales bacterium]